MPRLPGTARDCPVHRIGGRIGGREDRAGVPFTHNEIWLPAAATPLRPAHAVADFHDLQPVGARRRVHRDLDRVCSPAAPHPARVGPGGSLEFTCQYPASVFPANAGGAPSSPTLGCRGGSPPTQHATYSSRSVRKLMPKSSACAAASSRHSRVSSSAYFRRQVSAAPNSCTAFVSTRGKPAAPHIAAKHFGVGTELSNSSCSKNSSRLRSVSSTPATRPTPCTCTQKQHNVEAPDPVRAQFVDVQLAVVDLGPEPLLDLLRARILPLVDRDHLRAAPLHL
jgi:hypothetical protein